MNSVCFDHIDQPAVATCVQCGNPVCSECRDVVAGKDVCKGCVDKIKARLESQMATAGATASAQSSAAYGAPPRVLAADGSQVQAPSGSAWPPTPAEATPYYAAKAPSIPIWRLPLGVLAAIVVGMIGAFIWEKVVLLSGWNIGYFTLLIGLAVGYTLVFVTQRAGLMPAILGGIIALGAQIYGYVLLTQDQIAKDPTIGHVPVLAILMSLPKIIDPIGWIIVAIGTWFGFKTPMRAQAR